MDPNLVHSSCERSAEHHTSLSVVTHSFKLRAALLAMWRDLAHPNLVAHNLHRLGTLSLASAKGNKEWFMQIIFGNEFGRFSTTYSGNCPSTRHTYSFITCLFLIWCSISLAFLGFLPNMRRPDVSLSNRWMVLRFFRLYSLARMKTTVLCR